MRSSDGSSEREAYVSWNGEGGSAVACVPMQYSIQPVLVPAVVYWVTDKCILD